MHQNKTEARFLRLQKECVEKIEEHDFDGAAEKIKIMPQILKSGPDNHQIIDVPKLHTWQKSTALKNLPSWIKYVYNCTPARLWFPCW